MITKKDNYQKSHTHQINLITKIENGADLLENDPIGQRNHHQIISHNTQIAPIDWDIGKSDHRGDTSNFSNVFNPFIYTTDSEQTDQNPKSSWNISKPISTTNHLLKNVNLIEPISAEKLLEDYTKANFFHHNDNLKDNQTDLRLTGLTSSPNDSNNNNPSDQKNLFPCSPADIIPSDDHHDPADQKLPTESPYKALRELIIPCLIAGLGSVATGIILAMVQTWQVFQSVPQLNILVPALLGLKDNVAMTLASRLSTFANLGGFDDSFEKNRLIISNMALAQCQASTVGLFTPFIAIAVSYISPSERHSLTFNKIVLLITGSVITSNVANFVLNSMICCLIMLCRRFKMNPDNIATPLAASFGDLTTMLSIAFISRSLFLIEHLPGIQIGILSGMLSLIPLYALLASKCVFTKRILIAGWFPICGAMLIQITGGLIMEHSLSRFTKLAVFQPLMNGVGSNLASIQTSRNSTYFNRRNPGVYLIENEGDSFDGMMDVSYKKASSHSSMARLLLLFSIPCHILFIFFIKLAYGSFTMTPLFFTCYMVAAVIQVAILIQISYSLVYFLWKRGFNPDNSALPFLTAFGDFIGAALLAMAFVVMMLFKDVNADSE
ncbi:solute carrier family 41 member 3-like [Brevipalpus obovatus]|uniref:solute carrier family 41 member 3-like n=1 Tax=Brevipalpus obovatus TaxID=246614 RepID=UPI003D9F3D8D